MMSPKTQKIKHFLVGFLCFFFSAEPILAQPNFHTPDSLLYSPAFSIYDSTYFTFLNIKEEYLDIHVKKKQLIKVNGLDAFPFIKKQFIPISFNPFYDNLSNTFNQHLVPGTNLQHVKLQKSSYKVYRNGEEITENFIVKTIENNVLNIDFYWPTTTYELVMSNVEPGDVIEVHLEYTFPYWFNWYQLNAFRIYLDTYLPSLQNVYVIKQHENLLNIYRGAEPNSIVKDKRQIIKTWELKNAPGALYEPNAKAYKNISWFEIGIKQDAKQFWHNYTLAREVDNQQYQMPYYIRVMRLRERESIWFYRVAKKRIADKQNTLFKQKLNEIFLPFQNASVGLKLLNTHNFISENFSYENDSLYFKEEETDLAKVGFQMRDERIREISRYAMYAKILYLFKIPFNTIYHFDSRVMQPDSNQLGNLFFNDFSFLAYLENEALVMNPKRAETGFYTNELPYFYSQNPALIFDMQSYFDDIFPTPTFHTFYQDTTETHSNKRLTAFEFIYSGESNAIKFNSKISLSGQFSTLSRNVYLKQTFPSPIAPWYQKSVFDKSNIKISNTEQIYSDKIYPFNHQFKSEGLIENGSPESLILINPALPALKYEKRYQSFYFDFKQEDVFRFTFYNFPSFEMEILKSTIEAIKIDCPAFSLQGTFKQLSDNAVIFELKFIVKKLKVEPKDYYQLLELQDAFSIFSN